MLKVGLIGCGFMGAMHANCYKNIDGVQLAAVSDIRREKAEAVSGDAVIYADGAELIENADVDVIDICLPTYLHTRYALLAMDKVKYIFIEKPVSLTVEEADTLLEKSEKTGCNVQIGQVIRFWDEYTELRRLLEGGNLGRVVNANFRRISPRPDWGWNDWLLKYELSGGAAQDLHIHDVDFVLSLFGEPQKFCSVKNSIGEKLSYVNTLMQYDGFAVSVEGTWDLPGSHPFEASFRVVCENGVIENCGGKFMRYDTDGAHEIVLEKKNAAGAADVGGNISDLGGYYNELVYFTERAKSGEKIEKASLADGAASLKFLKKELAFQL